MTFEGSVLSVKLPTFTLKCPEIATRGKAIVALPVFELSIH